jgi:hypothetical protein
MMLTTRPRPWRRRITSATPPARSTPASPSITARFRPPLTQVYLDQVARVVPPCLARPAARAQENAVRRQDAEIAARRLDLVYA